VVGEELVRGVLAGGEGGGGDTEAESKIWTGGVPCIMRASVGEEGAGDEGWVSGLNGLLKFNYPFGEEDAS